MNNKDDKYIYNLAHDCSMSYYGGYGYELERQDIEYGFTQGYLQGDEDLSMKYLKK